MRDREIVGLHQAYLDVYSNLNYNQDIVEVAEYLVAEGYADSYEEAEYIIEDMSDEEFEELCEKKLAHSFPLKPKDRRSAENIGRMNAGDFSVPPEEENVRVRSARKVKPEPAPAPSKTRSSRRRIEFDDRSGSSDQGRRKLNSGMEYDTFDAILEHLVAEGYADTNESALAIMANMSDEWRQSIVEAAADQSDKQIEKGVKTTYKAQNVLDNQHQGRSKGLNKLPRGEREEKAKRMRGRLETRRSDLFGERNKREDESRAELKKKYGL